MRGALRMLAGAAVLLSFLVGCSSAQGSNAGTASSASSSSDCASALPYDPDTYSPGLSKPGAGKSLTFVLAGADPAPPATYANTWTVEVTDANGQPVPNATVSIKTWMPLHGHSSSVAPTVTSNGDGTYTVSVYLFMPGLWQITVAAQAGTTTDSAMFTFCT